MSNTQTKNLPTHRIYSVMRNGDAKAKWQELGAAFQHKDGLGFSLQFAARPLEGAAIVLRIVKPKKAAKVAE